MNPSNTAFLSLGSNLGNKEYQLQKALFLLGEKVGEIATVSPVYASRAWGFEGDDFLNICICLQTPLNATELLKATLGIENALGRERKGEIGYQSRTMDIDILYFNQEIIQNQELTIPHPHLTNRAFVLKPLADIAPQLYHPVLQKDSRNFLQECKDKSEVHKTPLTLFKSRELFYSHLNFIAIEGNIGAGKTTLAKKISEDFNAKLILERFADNPFLPKFYEDQARYAFPLEMSFLADRYQQFTDDTSQFDLFKKFMVSDYDIYKSLIFAKITLQQEEFALYRKIFNFMYREVKKPKIYVYLYQRIERLLENIKKRGRDYEQNISPDYLEKIQKGYLDFIKSYPEQNNLLIDISDLDFVSNQEDYELILDKIQAFAMRILL